jgi:CDP-paratose 2-epimerase
MIILVTGGAGFVGSSLAISLKKHYPSYEIYALDNLKRRGSELNIKRLKMANIQFIHGDIRLKEDFDAIPKVDVVIEASAEPSVLAGLNGSPDYLINTNLIGTINCVHFARNYCAIFIFLSTSRVYPIKTLEKLIYAEGETRFILENDQQCVGVSAKGINEYFPLDGVRSLYGATKLASELLIQEFNHFYNLQTVINRCGVLTGPWQMGKVDQGVLGLWVIKHFYEQELSYIGFNGTGKQTRDMLHVYDLYRLIDWQIHNIERVNGEVFNVGGGLEKSTSLLELTKICQDVTGKIIPIKTVAENRTTDIPLYITDNTKVTNITGWTPEISIRQIVEEIHEWLVSNTDQLKCIFE